MTKDENLPELDSWFRSLNPQKTAIAAWRAGRAKSLRPQTWEDLFTLILGAPGIAQRTATAAIYQHNRALATSPTAHQLPFFHHVHWTDEFQGWLLDVIAPPHPNLEAKHIEPHCKAWHVALAQANAGSQRQRFWVNEQKTQRSVLSLSEVNRNISTFCQH